jgi:hypothetical protein
VNLRQKQTNKSNSNLIKGSVDDFYKGFAFILIVRLVINSDSTASQYQIESQAKCGAFVVLKVVFFMSFSDATITVLVIES